MEFFSTSQYSLSEVVQLNMVGPFAILKAILDILKSVFHSPTNSWLSKRQGKFLCMEAFSLASTTKAAMSVQKE